MAKGRMPLRACGPFLFLLLAAGCGDRSRPSADDNRQLQDAEEMLNNAPGALADINDNGLEGAEAPRNQPQ